MTNTIINGRYIVAANKRIGILTGSERINPRPIPTLTASAQYALAEVKIYQGHSDRIR